MRLLGILVGLGLLVFFAFRGWSVLLLAPVAALVAASFDNARSSGPRKLKARIRAAPTRAVMIHEPKKDQ